MSIIVEGSLQKSTMALGTWALVTTGGETYELKGAPRDRLKNGVQVKVEGTIRDDVMTTAMIGPVLEVNTFEVL